MLVRNTRLRRILGQNTELKALRRPEREGNRFLVVQIYVRLRSLHPCDPSLARHCSLEMIPLSGVATGEG